VSIEAVSWALSEAPNVPPSCVAVLVGLANHADADGRGAWPSQATLAKYARKSERAVRADLAQLETLGLIVRAERGSKRTIVWNLAMARLAASTTPAGSTPPATPEASFRPARKPTSAEPAFNRQGTNTARSARDFSNGKNRWTPPERRGAALPPPAGGDRCPKPGHVGQVAGRCIPCRSEALEAAA